MPSASEGARRSLEHHAVALFSTAWRVLVRLWFRLLGVFAFPPLWRNMPGPLLYWAMWVLGG